MIKECLPKVGIKIRISCQNIIPCFLTICSSDQSLLSFQIGLRWTFTTKVDNQCIESIGVLMLDT